MLKTTIKLTIVVNRKLISVDERTTKLAGIGSAWGRGPAVLNRSSMLELLMYFALGFSPK